MSYAIFDKKKEVMSAPRTLIGTAGWSIPTVSARHFDGPGTHLQRYARVLTCAEINSSFHRSHAAAVYAKWAALTPSDFQFAVKVPRIVTHDQALRRARRPLEQFLAESAGLGQKRGPLLVQLPPSLAFDPRVARRFFALLRDRFEGGVVCEPRHPSWFSPTADAVLVDHRVARVAADPPVSHGAEAAGGWRGMVYYRLHGSPRKYWSRYPQEYLTALSEHLRGAAGDAWCIFDNTASGAAIENALELHSRLSSFPAAF